MRRGSCCVMIERKQTGLIRKVAIKAPILDLALITSFYLIVFYCEVNFHTRWTEAAT